MTVFTSYLTEFIPVGFPVPVGSEVYAVLGDEKILLSSEDAKNVVYILRNEYWKDEKFSPDFDHDFNIGFEIGNNRYAVSMDSYVYAAAYFLDGTYRCGGGCLYVGRPVNEYYYKYFDDDYIKEYFKYRKENKLNEV